MFKELAWSGKDSAEVSDSQVVPGRGEEGLMVSSGRMESVWAEPRMSR